MATTSVRTPRAIVDSVRREPRSVPGTEAPRRSRIGSRDVPRDKADDRDQNQEDSTHDTGSQRTPPFSSKIKLNPIADSIAVFSSGVASTRWIV